MIDPFGWVRHSWQRHTGARESRAIEHPGWPEVTETVRIRPNARFPRGAEVRLRPLHRTDGADWRTQRLHDEAHLRHVEPTMPTSWVAAHSFQAWWNHLWYLGAAARQGVVVPFAIECNGRFAGQLTLGNIQHGSVSECWIGYWVFSEMTGGHLATVACALGTDHAFRRVGMHRVTATFLPNNAASGRVLFNNGFREEGIARRSLHIDGEWRDHHLVALVRDDFPDSCVARLRAAGVLD
ncbi:GNAT family N-acetyltransferase [Corynebacterium confusum]|uniref:GNAT family N-acetyltransferase n=1 Tax=Corynebacterium confusum TaxID=71254 RepID=UPI0025B57046|nr:GNAT family protein [Corynebacterium confusum]WJY89328.1 Putative ribosomal N-acetyltransferase YdaF [Corynebacterium confusum]